MALPPVAEMEAYIRRKAVEMGIDPDVAVRVARSEGLRANTWQSDLQQPYGREASYGPFQLHVDPTGKRPGMGNDFMAATGLNPADPANWDEGIDFALMQARQAGWGPWMGAAKEGITGMMGIGGKPADPKMVAYNTDDTPAMGAAMGGFASGPGDVQERMDTGTVAGLLDEDTSMMGGFDGVGFAKVGMKILDNEKRKKAAATSEESIPKAVVLQPLQRYTLKGLI
jgi:hypothetical protein